MPEGGFSTTEICRITGIPYDTMFGWMHSGLVVPSIAQPQGRGKRARWAFRDLVAIRTVQQLRKHGVSMQGLRRVVSYIQAHKGIEHPLSECWLVTDGHDIYMLDGKKLLSLLRRPGQLTLFHLIDMKRTTDDLRAKVQPLPAQRQTKTPEKQHERQEKRFMTA